MKYIQNCLHCGGNWRCRQDWICYKNY